MKNIKLINIATYLFFTILLLLGISVFTDYGVHNDEYTNQMLGKRNFDYILNVLEGKPSIDTLSIFTSKHDFQHGPIIEIFLTFLQTVFDLKDSRDILFMRHICCFLIFYIGVIFFYKLCVGYFKSQATALLGCLFLVLSPRIFANSFYNTYDIPFLSLYIITLWTLQNWLNKNNLLAAFYHAFACALLIGVRPIGLIVPLITFLAFLILTVKTPHINEKRKNSILFICYSILLAILTTLFWPLLWQSPIKGFMRIIEENLRFSFPFQGRFLYIGQLLTQKELPWHYVPLWMLITIPISYILFFCVGCYTSIRSFFHTNTLQYKLWQIILLLYFFIPLLLTKGKLYDTWRHIYFIYPIFVIFSLIGINNLLLHIQHCLKNNITSKTFLVIIITLTSLDIFQTAHFMIKEHPLQNVYFNKIAGATLKEIKSGFDIDYWGLAYKQALEKISNKNASKVILINRGRKIRNNISILPRKERKRFKQVTNDNLHFLLTNYQQHPDEYPYTSYLSINIDKAKIIGVYKIRE